MADDPWVMYFVVRKDRRLDLPAAVALAGDATIACARRFGETHAAAFDAWRATAVRKVAVRASAEELEAVLAAHEAVRDERGLACLPPLRRSDAGEPLASLPAFTDARRPAVPTPQPPSDGDRPDLRRERRPRPQPGQGDGAGRPRRADVR